MTLLLKGSLLLPNLDEKFLSSLETGFVIIILLLSILPVIIYGEQFWRPYCHVKDFARLIQMVIEAPIEKVLFEIFNAGGDVNNATKQMIVDTILKRVPNGKVKYQDHGSDPRNYRVNFDKVKNVFGFEPNYTIEDGISELICAIKDHIFDHVDKNRYFFGNYEINYPIFT